jgi:hypothetical protein
MLKKSFAFKLPLNPFIPLAGRPQIYRHFYNFDAMSFFQQLFLYVSFTALLFLLIGLYKPWVMLWWEDVQNRRKVIRVYGLVALVSHAAYWGMVLLA